MKNVVMINGRWVGFFNALSNIRVVGEPAFKYAIGYNVLEMEKVAKAIEKARVYDDKDPEFQSYIAESTAILQQYATDSDGNPNVRQDPNGNTVRIVPAEKVKSYTADMDNLSIKYKELMEKLVVHQRNFNKVLDEEVALDLWEIKLSNVPKDLPQEIFNLIVPIVIYDLE